MQQMLTTDKKNIVESTRNTIIISADKRKSDKLFNEFLEYLDDINLKSRYASDNQHIQFANNGKVISCISLNNKNWVILCLK